jgi:hypothetical protein
MKIVVRNSNLIKLNLTIMLMSLILVANSQNWMWASSPFSPPQLSAVDEGMSSSIDDFGNMYSTGWFSSPSLAFNTTTLINSGSASMFLTKHDSNGNEIWAKKEGGGYFDGGYSVTNDAIGNVIVSGYFSSPSITIGSTTLINNNVSFNDAFLIKYDPNGNVIWTKSFGGSGDDAAFSVKTDSNGNIFVTGYYSSPNLLFGSSTLNNSGNGNEDIFLAKYDANGNFLWAKRAGGSSDDFSNSVCTDASGNAYITGYFNSSPITFGATTFTALGSFVTKYDSNGNVVWAKRFGGLNEVVANSISTQANGNILVTGYFKCDTLVVGTNTLINAGAPAIPGNAKDDVFFIKYNPNGTVISANRIGGIQDERGRSVCSFSNGFYIAGEFLGPTLPIGNFTLTAPVGVWDGLFIAKFDLNNNLICASVIASGGDDAIGLSVDQSGSAYLVGDFISHNFVVGSNTLTINDSLPSENIFFAKYSCGFLGNDFVSIDSNQTLVYPNPANSQLFIKSDKSIVSVELYDITGKVLSKLIPSDSLDFVVDLKTISQGIYFVKLLDDTGHSIIKKVSVVK